MRRRCSDWLSLTTSLTSANAASALIAVGSLLSATFAAFVAYKLGRGAAKEDRLRMHELDSIVDTRDRLLDVVRLGEALALLSAGTTTPGLRATSAHPAAASNLKRVAERRHQVLL